MEQEERSRTEELLQDIRSSLIGYALVNGHLPCPDCPSTGASASCAAAGITVNDGIEDGVDSGTGVSPRAGNVFNSCAVVEGNMPWVTLGLTEFDAWENHFTYRVTESFADDVDGTGCGTATLDVSFEICSTGNIDVLDDAGNFIAEDLPAVVISYGSNANEPSNPVSASETENQDNLTEPDSIFIQKDYASDDSADAFDDMLIWIPSSSLIYRMVQAERLP